MLLFSQPFWRNLQLKAVGSLYRHLYFVTYWCNFICLSKSWKIALAKNNQNLKTNLFFPVYMAEKCVRIRQACFTKRGFFQKQTIFGWTWNTSRHSARKNEEFIPGWGGYLHTDHSSVRMLFPCVGMAPPVDNGWLHEGFVLNNCGLSKWKKPFQNKRTDHE